MRAWIIASSILDVYFFYSLSPFNAAGPAPAHNLLLAFCSVKKSRQLPFGFEVTVFFG
jgi:hypothetical protein